MQDNNTFPLEFKMLNDTDLWRKYAAISTSRISQIAISKIFLALAKESFEKSMKILDFVK